MDAVKQMRKDVKKYIDSADPKVVKMMHAMLDDTKLDSPSLPGSPLSLSAFKKWIADAETANTVSLKEAKIKWAGKRKQLQNLTR